MELLKPNKDYKNEYIKFIKQVREYNEVESSYPYDKLIFLKYHFDKYLEFLEHISAYPKGDIVIPMKHYWAVENNIIVGRITLRVNSTEELFEYIGNIGYLVAPEERNKGYATEMLRLVKFEAREQGYRKLLLTCNKNNLNSKKVIEKNDGIFLDEIYWEEKNMRNLRYEIYL